MKTIYLTGIVGLDITANKLREDFNSETKEKRRIILNSVGGSVSEGFEIYNLLKAYKGDIEIVFGSIVASIAAYFSMAVPKANRKAFKNSSFMLHEASSVAEGRARDFLTFYERLEGINNIMAEAVGEGMEISKEVARDIMREDKFYVGWEALVDNNIISDVIEPKEIDIPKKEENESQFIFMTGMMAELEKQQDMTVVKAKMYEVEDKINADIKKSQADIQKAAALLKLDDTKNVINPVKLPVENKINQEVNKMKLADYLKTDPEALAEYNQDLNTAKAQEREKITQEKASDRSRIVGILKASGIALTEDAASAIEKDVSAGDFALAEIERQRNIQDKASGKDSPFSALIAKQTPKDQTVNAVEDDAAALKAFDEKAEKAVAGILPKKKEVK